MEDIQRIKIPYDKLSIFEKWWNEDIRHEKTIPHAFEKGYLMLNFKQDLNSENARKTIKTIAHSTHSTYRNVENMFKTITGDNTMLYFEFLNDNKLHVERYADNILVSVGTYEIGEDEILGDTRTLDAEWKMALALVGWNEETAKLFMNSRTNYCVIILATALWYIATQSRNTKYVYTEQVAPITRTKKVAIVSDTKRITAPIYDFGKVRTITIDRLKKRKQGWTYSHAFSVHGHYRHYKSGKVIFIKPFIKGKDKEFKNQEIVLLPKEL